MAVVLLVSPASAQDVVVSGSDPAIEDIEWRIADVPGATLYLDGGTATATATATDDCGSATVPYTLEPDIVALRFDDPAASVLCIDTADAVDLLARVDGYEILVDGARLVDGGARPILELVAVAASGDPTGTWNATGFDAFADGALVAPLEGSRLSVTFGRDGNLVGTTGCGEFIGAYGFDGPRVSIGIRATGVSACTDAVRAEEVDFTSALQSVARWVATADGHDLFDTDGLLRVRLVQEAAASPQGEWRVTRFIGANGVADEPIESVDVTIRLGPDGRLDGSNGCRLFEGSYLLDGESIVISEASPIGPRCDRAFRRQERRFFAALDAAVSWAGGGATLELRDGSGRPVVELTEFGEG